MRTGITGSSGFIGSHLTRWLAASGGAPLRLLLRNTGRYELAGAEVCKGDLHSRADCERFADGLQVIYYLAHENTPVNSDRDQPTDVRVNLEPLLNLLQAVERAGTRPHIVYFSSGGAVYARKAERVPFRETDACRPSSSYGILKLAAEEYLRLAADRGYLTATVLRVGNAYGALLPRHRMQGLIGVALGSLLQGAPIRVFGDLDNVRDYIHLDDICAIAERVAVPRTEFDVFNVGSGLGHSVAEVLRVIEECHGSPLQLERHEEEGRWLTDWAVLDAGKAAREWDWRPKIALAAGVRTMMSGWHNPVPAIPIPSSR